MNRADRRRQARTAARPAMPSGVTIIGGPGDTRENAYVVHGAPRSQDCLAAEYAHLARKFGVQGVVWKRVDARTRIHGERVFDEIVLEAIPNKARWSVFFDVTETVASPEALASYGEHANEVVKVSRFRFDGANAIVAGALLHGPRGHGYAFTVSTPERSEIGLPEKVHDLEPTLSTREAAIMALEAHVATLVPPPWTKRPWEGEGVL